jgi:transglutaminase-like putative cysteine protease
MLAQLREYPGKILVDCDDAAILMAALGESIGIPARLVAVAFFDPGADFSHVWTELFDGDRWRVIDPTRGSQPLDMRLVTRIMMLDV